MPGLLRSLGFIVTVALGLPLPALAQGAAKAAAASAVDEVAVRIPLEAYLRGHATGDSAAFRRAFFKEAKLLWVRDGQLATRTSDEYVAGASGRPPADEAQRKRWIESVDIAGNAAFAKIVLDYPTTRFVDYMALLKVGGEWWIISKSFSAEPKARP
jgi:Putative lumazine-binding